MIFTTLDIIEKDKNIFGNDDYILYIRSEEHTSELQSH